MLEEDSFFPAKANFDFTELMKSVILILCLGGNTNFLCIDVVAEVSLLACTVGGKQESSSKINDSISSKLFQFPTVFICTTTFGVS